MNSWVIPSRRLWRQRQQNVCFLRMICWFMDFFSIFDVLKFTAFIYLFVWEVYVSMHPHMCIRVCVCWCHRHGVCVEVRGQLLGALSSLYHVCPGHWIQGHRLGGKLFAYWVISWPYFWNIFIINTHSPDEFSSKFKTATLGSISDPEGKQGKYSQLIPSTCLSTPDLLISFD